MNNKTKYTKAVVDEICERIAGGESLKAICESDHLPSRITINKWLTNGKYPDFQTNYEVATLVRAENMFDELLEIADNDSKDYKKNKKGETVLDKNNILRDRLRVDVRKWKLSRMFPKKYGDRMVNEITGELKVTPYEQLIKDLSDNGTKDK